MLFFFFVITKKVQNILKKKKLKIFPAQNEGIHIRIQDDKQIAPLADVLTRPLRIEHSPFSQPPYRMSDCGEFMSIQGEEYFWGDSGTAVADDVSTCDCDYVDDVLWTTHHKHPGKCFASQKMPPRLLPGARLFGCRAIPFSVTFCGMQVRSMKLQWCCDYHSALTALIGECLCLQSIARGRKLKPK